MSLGLIQVYLKHDLHSLAVLAGWLFRWIWKRMLTSIGQSLHDSLSRLEASGFVMVAHSVTVRQINHDLFV